MMPEQAEPDRDCFAPAQHNNIHPCKLPISMYATHLAWPCLRAVQRYKKVLIDPFVPDGSVARTNPDLVAVTHGHHDHLGEAVALKKPTVAIGEIARYLMEKGVTAEGMNIGGTITLDGVTITMTPALHSVPDR